MFQNFQTPAYAGFWLRFAAYLIDSIILCAVFIPLGVIVGLAMGATGEDPNSGVMTGLNLLTNVVSIVAGWLYSSLLESSSWQGTVGKKLVGVRVTDLDGYRISFGRATGRHFAKILSGMICLIGFIMVAFTEKNQGLHDMMAGTLVLSGPTPEMLVQPPPPPDFNYRGSFGEGLR